MPNVKVPTTFRCRWVPNRRDQRRFTEADAARIVCDVIARGSSKARIDALVEKRCPQGGRRPQGTSEAAEALELAALNIQSNIDELRQVFLTFRVINGLLDALAFLSAFFPVTRPVRVAAQAARAVMQVRTASVLRQQAANDAAYVVVRQAAANERFFLQQGGVRR